MLTLTYSTLKKASMLLLIAVLFSTGCQQPKPDPSVELKPLIDKYVEIWNNGNVDELSSIFDPGFLRNQNNLPEVKGIEALKNLIIANRTAYPDMKITADNMVYGENMAAGRWIFTGTNTGPGEMPPTGKAVNFWGISIFHFANGKITTELVANDNQILMEQLGFKMMPMEEEKK